MIRILLVGFGCIVLVAMWCIIQEQERGATGQTPEIVAKIGQKSVQGKYGIEELLNAIEQVESNGNSNAIGDNGYAVGCMQIHPIMVKDVNRILGWDGYTLDDRYDRDKSRQMCKIYLYHYCKDMSLEGMARCWNGGPTGYKKDCTKKYWEKVKRAIEGE